MPLTQPAHYVDPDCFERERWSIFAKEWIAIGDAAQLQAPGAYRALTVAGFPIVVVNDAGQLRGFHNVCRHRAGPMVWDGTGSCQSFVCRYHGWAYGLDGSCKSARDFGEDLPLEEFSLYPVSVECWRGLMFINLDPDPPALDAWLGEIVPRCAGFDLERFIPTHHSSHEIAANWKIYAENYQEGYHIPLVHPGLNRQIEASRYEVEIHGAATVHSAPTRDGAITAGAWLWRFPGFALNIYESGMSIETYWPTGPATTAIEYTFFFSSDTSARHAQAAVDNSVLVLDEDRKICEAVQRNLAANIFRPRVVSPRHEAGVLLVQSLVEGARRRI